MKEFLRLSEGLTPLPPPHPPTPRKKTQRTLNLNPNPNSTKLKGRMKTVGMKDSYLQNVRQYLY